MADDIKLKVEVDVDSSELKNVNKNLTNTGKKVEDVGTAAKKSKTGLKSMAVGFKGIGTALKAAGIGIFLSIIAALFSLMKENQAVMDFMNKATKTLSILFNNLTSSLGPLKETLTGLFENPKQALIDFGNLIKDRLVLMVENFFGLFVNGFGVLKNLIKGAGFALAGIFDDDAAAEADVYFEKAGESAKEFGKNVMVVSNMDLVVKAVVKTAEVVGELGDQLDEAATAADAFVKKENELKLAEAELGKMIAKNSLEIANEKLVRDDLNASIEDRLAAAASITKMIEDESAASIKLQEDKIALMKEDLKLTNTTVQDKIDIANAEAKLATIQAQASTRLRENMMKTTILSKQESEKAIAIETEKGEKIAEAQKAADDKAKEAQKELNSYFLGLEEATKEHKLEQIETELEDLEVYYEDKLISHEAYLLRKQELEDKADELSIEATELTQGEKLKIASKALAAMSNILSALEGMMEDQMNEELKAAEGNEQKQDQIRAEYAEKKKKMAIAGVLIDAASAIIGTWAGYASAGTYGTILAGIQTGLIAVLSTVQLAKINSATFADGGILDGPSHAQGGIQTGFGELEGGEGVINAGSMSNVSLRNLASAANTGGGGKDFSSGDGSIKLDGGSISAIVGGINNKKVYLTETDMTETQEQVAVMEEEATI